MLEQLAEAADRVLRATVLTSGLVALLPEPARTVAHDQVDELDAVVHALREVIVELG